MPSLRKHQLIEIEWPRFGQCEPPAGAEAAEYQARIDVLRAAMEERNLTHVVVYGDREHFANMAYLTGFDPRFEESLLIVAAGRDPLIVVGNECVGYLPVSPLYREGRLRSERFQTFSLLDQPRDSSRPLGEILRDEGIGPLSKVGCVGWKYLTPSEHPDSAHAIDLPAYVVDELRALAGHEKVVNVTDLLMHPGYGLRSSCSAAEIAYFEYTNVLASEGMRRMLFGLCDGITDHELAQLAGYNGTPLGCHMTMLSGSTRDKSLTSPVGATISRGDPFATNICYWGSNICRAGWVAVGAADLPAAAQDYVERFAGVYFAVMSEWYHMVSIGTPGGALARLIAHELPYERFGIYLNAGHLIHLDEWLSSPIYAGSALPIRSGMVIQVDVIPDSEVYFSTRMEDGVAIADRTLRQQIEAQYPDCFARCQARRRFMTDTLGIDLPEEVLPLSNMPAIVPPYFLKPNTVLAMEQ